MNPYIKEYAELVKDHEAKKGKRETVLALVKSMERSVTSELLWIRMLKLTFSLLILMQESMRTDTHVHTCSQRLSRIYIQMPR